MLMLSRKGSRFISSSNLFSTVAILVPICNVPLVHPGVPLYYYQSVYKRFTLHNFMNKVRVIVLEDHQVTLDGLCYALSKDSSIEVVGSATESDTGLQLVLELKPDVVILDLHLPGTRGPRSMVEAYCKQTQARVIIFSSEKRPAFVDAVKELGVAGYLLKTETADKVIACIREVAIGRPEPVLSSSLDDRSLKPTEAELDLLKMFAEGLKYQDIANKRGTSPSTVRKQCDLLLEKLGLTNREELIAWAANNGYGSLERDQ